MRTNTPSNFWAEAPKPLMILAPMEDVTDTSFRELIIRNSAPGKLNVVYTEFTSTEGLTHEVGLARVAQRLFVSESERQWLKKQNVKIVAQVWGKDPEKYRQAIEYITEHYDFDGIDINMGCPVRKVVAHGSCAALINNEPLAAQIIAAARQSTSLPLSIKTRLGVKKVETQRWMEFLLQQPLEAIILHGRIQKQMSEGEANWDEIGRAVELKNQWAPHIKIIGNGDVSSLEDGHDKSVKNGTDGAMIGRGIFKNPWLFARDTQEVSMEDRLQTLLLHVDLFEKNWGTERHFPMLRRFFKIYLNGFTGAAALRNTLMQVEGFGQARHAVQKFLQQQRQTQPDPSMY